MKTNYTKCVKEIYYLIVTSVDNLSIKHNGCDCLLWFIRQKYNLQYLANDRYFVPRQGWTIKFGTNIPIFCEQDNYLIFFEMTMLMYFHIYEIIIITKYNYVGALIFLTISQYTMNIIYSRIIEILIQNYNSDLLLMVMIRLNGLQFKFIKDFLFINLFDIL